MNNLRIKLATYFWALVFNLFFTSFAYSLSAVTQDASVSKARYAQEKHSFDNPFTISFYEPTYVLPISYSTGYNSIYIENNPYRNSLKRLEFDFKLSLKFPLITYLFHKDNALYVAYTQSSFWQVYHDSAFFRNNDYKPEIFFISNLDISLGKTWVLQALQAGIMHESNGYGDILERSWNRIYLETIFSNNKWIIGIRPWYIINDSSLKLHNNDIAHYLGHERVIIAYNYKGHVLSGELYNIERITHLASVRLAWSFPLTTKIKGYVQFYHGFGHGLIDYNKRKNNVSLGLAFSDWV